MRSDVVLFPVVWVAVVVFVVVLFWLVIRRQRKRDKATAKERADAIKDAIAKKILLPSGKPACVVCQNTEATERWPVVDSSWLDKFTPLKQLYALTPRYEIQDGQGEQYELLLCSNDKRMIVQKWQEVLSSKRTMVQQLFSQIESELGQLQNGMMLAWARTEHTKSIDRLRTFLGTSGTTIPLLNAREDEHAAPISMPAMTTDVETEGEDTDSGENKD
jgi:hypothetical protein